MNGPVVLVGGYEWSALSVAVCTADLLTTFTCRSGYAVISKFVY